MQARRLTDLAKGGSRLARPLETRATGFAVLAESALRPLEARLSAAHLGESLLLRVLWHRVAQPKRRTPGYVSTMADPFIRWLSADARILVDLEGRPMERYAVMLQLRIEGKWQTIRLLDNAHGDHDMHRYTGSEKQPAERFSEGAVNEVVPQAIRYLIDHWEAIAESWKN